MLFIRLTVDLMHKAMLFFLWLLDDDEDEFFLV